MNTKSNPITPLSPEQTAYEEKQAAKEGYIHRVLVAFDIFCNVVFFRGQQDETISSHSARAALEGKLWGIWLSKALDWIQPDHGAKAIAGDVERAENVERIENDTKILE